MTDSVFLFSSDTGVPERWFNGYCFIGCDFIAGAEGAQRYHETTGRDIPIGEDGCYVTIHREGHRTRVGADFMGYKHLYYYAGEHGWAFSNSLIALVRHLRAHNVPLSIDRAQLMAWSHLKPFTAQAASFRTAVDEIRILPSFCCLEIEHHQLSVVAQAPLEQRPYAEALEHFITLWLGRMAALLRQNTLSVIADLTGGRDSRTVLSLFLAARERLGDEVADNFWLRSGTAERQSLDLNVARTIASRYGVRLNDQTPKPAPMAVEHAYADWKDLSLGVYTPVYFPYTLNSLHHVYFGGGGGGAHRYFYPCIDPLKFLQGKHKRFADPALVTQWHEQVLETIETLTSHDTTGHHPLLLHYREFRDRFHVGRALQHYTMAAPLGSRWLITCSNACSQAFLESNRIFVDIMENLVPGLATMPYESDHKMPTAEQLAQVTRVNVPEVLPHGHVYTGEASSNYSGRHKAAERLTLLRDDIASHHADILAAGIDGEQVEETLTQLAQAIDGAGMGHASNGRRAAWLLLAGELHRRIGRYR